MIDPAHLLTRREALLACVAAAASIAAAPRSLAGAQSGYALVDAMPALSALLDSAAGADSAALVKRFRTEIIARYPEAYVFFGTVDDETITSFLADVATRADAQRRLSAQFPAAFEAIWTRFVAAMPPTHGDRTTVYLAPASHDMMGGSVRVSGARDVVLLGSEEMADRIEDRRALTTYLHHELTHLCHNQNNREMRQVTETFLQGRPGPRAKLYQLMWLEGLAVHCSKVLNPNASTSDILLSEDLPARVEARWARLIEGMQENFDTEDRPLIINYVFSGDTAQDIPRSAAYYIGMRVADEVAKRHDTRDLIGLQGEALRSEMLRALQGLKRA
jgi:hypothetical protein